MSLFSGIKFSSDKAKALAAEREAHTVIDASNAASNAPSDPAAPPVVNPLLAASHTLKPAASSSKLGSGGSHSASLQFAPRRPKPARPATKTVYSPAPTAASVVEAAPVLVVPPPSAVSSLPKADEVVIGEDGNPVVRAPAMTLAAAQKEQGKKGDNQQQRKRKKKRKRHMYQQQIFHEFQPDEDYDPNRPNDLGEYQHYREQVRQERRTRYLEERRRKAAGETDDSSNYSDSSEDAAPRRDAPKMFAPPKSYEASAAKPPVVRQLPPAASLDRPSPTTGDNANVQRASMSQAATGDDAYARRAAMTAATGDDAYARRAAMSSATGDDAYARRATFSQRPPLPPAGLAPRPPPTLPVGPPEFSGAASLPLRPPAFKPPSTDVTAGAPPPFRPPPQHLVSGAPAPFRPPPSHLMSGTPRPPPPGGAPPFPPTMVPGLPPRPPPGTPATLPPRPPAAPPQTDPGYQKQLEEKMRAAEAVAAKFRALTEAAELPKPPSSTAPANESGTFAERMFRKWGHTEGKGLGVREDGITHALTAEHVLPQVDTSKMSKRQLAKHRAALANAKARKWVQASSARGRIINVNEEVRTREDLEKYGEVSRVVCLTGVAEDPEEISDDLTDEIGEECSKHGIVERVVLHLVEPPPTDPADGLRIFVVFSGVAGAWRATRELNGRFFSGQTIHARYFDEDRFIRGERDGNY